MEKTCFVIMPICEEGSEKNKLFREIYQHMIKPAVEGSELGLRCLRADEINKSGSIIKDIISMLKTSDVLVADLTDRNPNVFYELGVRHALSKRSILIAQDINDIPFDLQAYRVIVYRPDLNGADRFKKQMKKYLEEITNFTDASDNPIDDYLKAEKNSITYENPFIGPGYEKWKELVFEILTIIAPAKDEFEESDWISLDSLFQTGIDIYGESKWIIGAISSAIKMIDLFGVINIKRERNTIKLQPISKISRYFIRSLAHYLKDDHKIFRSWGREGTSRELSENLWADYGPYFLKALESRRMMESKERIPLREAKVAIALIKSVRKNRDVYLFMYDQVAQQYQSLGGRMRPDDIDVEETLIREVEEELEPLGLTYKDEDFKYKRILKNVEKIDVSPTYGVSTHYKIDIFQIFFKKLPVSISPNHKWLTKEEISSGKTKNGIRIFMSYLSNLEESIKDGISALPLSCKLDSKGKSA